MNKTDTLSKKELDKAREFGNLVKKVAKANSLFLGYKVDKHVHNRWCCVIDTDELVYSNKKLKNFVNRNRNRFTNHFFMVMKSETGVHSVDGKMKSKEFLYKFKI